MPFDTPASSLSMILLWGVDIAETDLQRTAARDIVASVVNKHASGTTHNIVGRFLYRGDFVPRTGRFHHFMFSVFLDIYGFELGQVCPLSQDCY